MEYQPKAVPSYMDCMVRDCPVVRVTVVAAVPLTLIVWLPSGSSTRLLLPKFLKEYWTGFTSALGIEAVIAPDVVSQIRVRSMGLQVKFAVFFLIARWVRPFLSSIPVG
jgi:hypothetical protein